MKIFLVSLVASTAVLPLQAQLFTPESVAGAALGGLAGGIIGHNSGGYSGEGIAIGAGTGLVLGALFSARQRDRAEQNYSASPPVIYVPSYPGAVNPYLPVTPPSAATSTQPPPAPSPTVEPKPVNRPNPMAGANSLFGR